MANPKLSSEALERRLREARFLIDRLASPEDAILEKGPRDDAFPSGPNGRVSDTNGLYRSNWFNGRFLTADAFRADQVYTDTRARMVAQIHPPGIAWGLVLTVLDPVTPPPVVPGQRPPLPDGGSDDHLEHYARLCKKIQGGASALEISTEIRQLGLHVTYQALLAWCTGSAAVGGGMPLGTRVALEPGLAFDDLGRPISVGARFEFTFTDLVQRYRTRPTVVIGGGTAFAPCACVEVLPPEAVPPGAALPEGPYLLVATPIESAEGMARVVPNPCAGRSEGGVCEAEGWRGGFELSLSRLRVEVPTQTWSTAWDLRGLLSGWYFDVYEHDLRSRWNRAGATAPYYPADPSFWRGPGPSSRVEAAVPLALVYLGPDGTVLFLDAWVPRRPIAATSSASWAANVRGAPTPAARIARVHQFQTMLHESLAAAPNGPDASGAYGPNLYQRGFRHIPPWGLLPVREPPSSTDVDGVNPLLVDARAIRQAKADARAYFEGTNVLVTTRVAIHDDDLLEDFADADEKDPITLRLVERTRRHADVVLCAIKQLDPATLTPLQIGLYVLLEAMLDNIGDLTLDQLVNREIEVVKLLIPMDPRRRELAVVGRVSDDPLSGLFTGWSTAAPRVDNPFADLACVPRRWVAYVKQRLVWLDALYLAVDLALDLFEVVVRVYGEWLDKCLDSKEAQFQAVADTFQPTMRRRSSGTQVPLATLRAAAAPIRAATAETARVLFEEPTFARALRGGLARTYPELALPGTWTAFDAARTGAGRDVALDALADVHPGFGVLKAAALVLPDATVDAVIGDLRTRAEASAPAGAATVATDTFHRGGYVAADPELRAVSNALRDAYAATPVRALDPAAPAEATVAEILAGTPGAAGERLGAEVGARVVEAVRRDADKLVAEAPKLAAAKALGTPGFFEALDRARAESGGDLQAAIEKLAKGSGENKAAAAALARVSHTLGPQGTKALVERLGRTARAGEG